MPYSAGNTYDSYTKKNQQKESNTYDLYRGYSKESPSPKRSLGGVAKDIGVSLAKGVVGLGEGVVGLADIATGGVAGEVLEEKLGYDPAYTQQVLGKGYSEAQQEAAARVEEAEGFSGKLKAYAQHPSVAAHQVVESLPSMFGGGAIAKGGLKLAPKLAPYIAGALGEGAITAGSTAEQIRQQKEGEYAAGDSVKALGAGMGTAALGYVGGRLANKFGFADADTMMAAWSKTTGGKKKAKDVVKNIIGGGISEGVFEEMPQSAQEAVWMNAALDKPLMEGVTEQMAGGLVTGGLMGAGANIIDTGLGALPAPKPEIIKPPDGPLTKAAEAQKPFTAEERYEAYQPEVPPDTGILARGALAKAKETKDKNQEMDKLMSELYPEEFKVTEKLTKKYPHLQKDFSRQLLDVDYINSLRETVSETEWNEFSEKALSRLQEMNKPDDPGVTEQDWDAAKTSALHVLQQKAKPEPKGLVPKAEVPKEELRAELAVKKKADVLTKTQRDIKEAETGIRDIRREGKPYSTKKMALNAVKKKDIRAGLKTEDYTYKVVPDRAGFAVQRIVGKKPEVVPKPKLKKEVSKKHIAPALVDAFEMMKTQVKEGETKQAVVQEDGTTKPTPSTYPDWFKQKQKGKFEGKWSEKEFNTLMKKAEAGKTFTEKQQARWNELEHVAQNLADTDPGLAEVQDIVELEKKGFEPVGQEMSVGNLKTGDKVVVKENGTTDEYEHKGYDKDGNAIMEDGDTKKLDPFEMLDVQAIKKTKREEKAWEPKEPEKIDEEAYLAREGAGRQALGEAALHKNIPEGKIKEKLVEQQRVKDEKILEKREKLREEYKEKVEAGGLKPLTREERLIRTAQGHPDNEATQAARNLLDKKGISYAEKISSVKREVPAKGIWGVEGERISGEDIRKPSEKPIEGREVVAAPKDLVKKPYSRHEPIALDEKINGITRKTMGELIADGDKAVVKDIQEGIEKHDLAKMQDTVRNQIMSEVAKAKKGKDRKAVQKNIAKLQEGIDEVLSKEKIEAPEDLIFIRKPKAAEKRGGKPRQDAMRGMPEKKGYETIYKPYGITGQKKDAGYYYQKTDLPSKEFAKTLADKIGKSKETPGTINHEKIWNSLPADEQVELATSHRRELNAKEKKALGEQVSGKAWAELSEDTQESLKKWIGRREFDKRQAKEAPDAWGTEFEKIYKKSEFPLEKGWDEFKAFSKKKYNEGFPVTEHFEGWGKSKWGGKKTDLPSVETVAEPSEKAAVPPIKEKPSKKFDPLALLQAKTEQEKADAQGITVEELQKQETKDLADETKEINKELIPFKKQIVAAKKQIKMQEAVVADWSSRKYKETKTTYRKKDMYGQYAGTGRVSDANERRRRGVIDLANHDIAQQKELIAKLQPKIDYHQKRLNSLAEETEPLSQKERDDYVDFLTKEIPSEVKLEDRPELETMQVDTKAIREKTGEVVTVKENAKEALEQVDSDIFTLQKLLDCL